jgi:flagellar motility protein MotE (MotC chaperone)
MASNPPNNNPQSQPLCLPSSLTPDALDTLTELISILSRLRTPTTLPSGTGTGQTPLPQSTTPSQQHATGSELTLKDIPTTTDHLKHKLQRARAQIRTLPDMERTIAQQDEEIKELEERIKRQREVLAGLRERGVKFAAGEREGESMDLE